MNQIRSLIAAVMNAAAPRLTPRTPVHPLPQFAGQHTNPKRNEERQLMRALGGRRQYKKRLHAARGAR